MKISLVQKCGLGNQLFQYAAGLYFAQRYGASLEIIRGAKPPDWELQERDFLLSQFRIETPVRYQTARDRLMCSVAAHKAPLAATARVTTHTQVYRQPFETDRIFVPSLPLKPGIRHLYLIGFFQTHQVAEAVESRLRRELILRDAATGKNLEVLERIQASECPVSLHVRRGDYTVLYNGRNALPLAYYENAMRTLEARLPANPTWFIFSDDIAWARENLPRENLPRENLPRESLPREPNLIFVDHNDEHHPHEDLRLMSSCHHHIAANSTFSWWGAWLNPRPDKIVCVPDTWLDPAVPSDDIVPPAWLRVSSRGESVP